MRKNKIKTAHLSAAVLLGILALSTAGCGKKSGAEVSAIQKAGVLNVALVDSQSSYTSVQDNTPVGVEPELAAYIAQALNVSPQFQICGKQEALNALNEGTADIALGCISRAAGISAECASSVSYGKGFFYAVTRKGDYALTVGALSNSVVGAAPNLDEVTRTSLYGAEGVSVADISSAEEAAKRLESGEIRAYICYENQAEQFLEDEDFQIQNISNLNPEEFAVAVRKSDQTLLSGINVLIPQFLEKE